MEGPTKNLELSSVQIDNWLISMVISKVNKNTIESSRTMKNVL